jgi:hypothetical protein
MPIGVFCVDAGAAEIISSYILKYNLTCIFSLKEPALGIFQRKLGYKIKDVDRNSFFLNSSWFLLGTSSNNYEYEIIKKAKNIGKKSVSYIDHWTGYNRRFLFGNVLQYPDEIWVTDIHSYKNAMSEIYNVKIRIERDWSLPERCINNTIDRRHVKVLYLGEPIAYSGVFLHGNKMHWGHDEIDAMNYFFKNIPESIQGINRVVIRPHPKDNKKKYNNILTEYAFHTTISEREDLIEDINMTDIVVGCATKAMVVALSMGKEVYSSLPPWSQYPKLPHDGIIYLK